MRLTDEDATDRLECFCSRRPLLARVGQDPKTGKPFVWVRAVKSQRVLVEVVVTSGTATVTCRECGRRHSVHVAPSGVHVNQVPEEV